MHVRRTYGFSPTFFLVVINLAVYIYTSFLGHNFIFTADSVLEVYGQYGYAVFHYGWWWQLITSMFVHVDIVHLASNTFFLLIFGLRAEELFTDTEYYTVYLASGLIGNLLSLFLPPLTVSAGASGAIFGLFGAVIVYLRKVVGRSVMGALLFAFMFLLITVSAGTNILAHFGGLVAGLGIGYWLAKNRKILMVY
ncbi:MAG: rhomboid family intramembrane serine protease [Candidatus Bathyarchaeota archaeon]|nr:rhomboid family intramembrane serine protease [Candidatus Bathyarchaeota archaeon]MDH5495041.1 rhomboid family intramembrane serine protease [Candidatus Bathyarchaeota archaeon]